MAHSDSHKIKPLRTTVPFAPNTGPLKVLSYNLDNQGTTSLPYLLDYARTKKVNIICLQESHNLKANHNSIAQQGYSLYLLHPKGKVCILVDNILTERHTISRNHVWYSNTFESLAVTLATKRGIIIIPNAYLPTALDQSSTTSTKHVKARDQHAELAELTSHHPYVILTMDGNETTHRLGRMQYITDPTTKTNPTPSPNHPTIDYANPTMACNLKRLQDTHMFLHPHL